MVQCAKNFPFLSANRLSYTVCMIGKGYVLAEVARVMPSTYFVFVGGTPYRKGI